MGVLWSHSGTIERDNNDVRAASAKAYFYIGGTTTPIAVYSNAAESSIHTDPVSADANGRWPNVFIPFRASYDVKVTTSAGTQLYYPTLIPNADPVEAVADAVDDEEILQVGHVHWEPIAGTKTGFVRLNGMTIGNAASGATERANADTSALFTYLWNGLANGQAAVSTGRGASAAADYAANKTIALLNGRSASLMGLDDMGNSAAGLLPISGIFSNGNATTAGSLLGENTHTMTSAEMFAHTHTFSATTSSDGGHTPTGTTSAGSAHSHTGSTDTHSHTYDRPNSTTTGLQAGGTSILHLSSVSVGASTGNTAPTFTTGSEAAHTHTITMDAVGAHSHSVSGTSGSTGSTTAFNTVHRALLGTYFQKL